MANGTYSVEMDGYWREINAGGLPEISGVYCVYECRFNTNNTVSLQRLLYIGESDNIRRRILGHEKKPLWKKYVGAGNELCYSCGNVPALNLPRVEAAMIHHHRPPCNTEYVNEFPFDATTVFLSGKIVLLTAHFTVYRTGGAFNFSSAGALRR